MRYREYITTTARHRGWPSFRKCLAGHLATPKAVPASDHGRT